MTYLDRAIFSLLPICIEHISDAPASNVFLSMWINLCRHAEVLFFWSALSNKKIWKNQVCLRPKALVFKIANPKHCNLLGIYVCLCVSVYICICICMCICMHTVYYIYVYICMYIYIYTHTHIQTHGHRSTHMATRIVCTAIYSLSHTHSVDQQPLNSVAVSKQVTSMQIYLYS